MKIRPFKNFGEFHAEHSLSAQLPYWDFLENIVTLSDGTLCSGLKISGLDIETWDEPRVNQLTMLNA